MDTPKSFSYDYIDGQETGRAYVEWNEYKSEWLESRDGTFLEGYEQGSVVYLPTSSGPQRVSLDGCRKILELYKVSEEAIRIEDVPETSPEDLMRISRAEIDSVGE